MSGALCQICSLCCDGSLFDVVPLAEGEAVPRGLVALPRKSGGRGVAQRCGALHGTSCSVYAERPAACRRHECSLFRALAEGEVGEAEARAVVAEAQARIAAVAALLPPGEPGDRAPMQRARRERPGAPELARAESFLDMHFGRSR